MLEHKSNNELSLQPKLYNLMSNPAFILQTTKGRRLQILSPGKINKLEGPDFKNVAIMLDGYVIVGDAEFHINSSDWVKHKHFNDSKYNNVILHIVCNDDLKQKISLDTLIVSEDSLNNIEVNDFDRNEVSSLEELQHFSLIRLLRKSSDIQELLNNNSIQDTLKQVLKSFIDRYESRRRRPVYNDTKLSNILEVIPKSLFYKFLVSVSEGLEVSIQDSLQLLLKTKIADEGASLRREIIINCILPFAVCLANDETRINLFLWYWSTPAITEYGILKRRYPNINQNFFWQQQGMLEYIKEHGRRTNIASNFLNEYYPENLLQFYKVGRYSLDDLIISNEY